jgi:hypothetical protein
MHTNLDALKAEIEGHLERDGFNVFHGYSRLLDSLPVVFWDTDRHPDYADFLKAAKAADVKMIVFHQREFSRTHVEDALERLEDLDLPRDEYRSLQRRLKDLLVYEGFTCTLELSFDFQGRIYIFDLRTEWYEELTDVLEEIEFYQPDEEEDEEEEEGPIGGYFSKN